MCPGCNCYNETSIHLEDLDDPAYYLPCCESLDGGLGPCIYAVIFGCDHSWPVVSAADGFGIRQYVGLPCDTEGFCGNDYVKWFYQVHRLKKECQGSCKWSETHIVASDIGSEACADFIEAKMIPCDGAVYFPSDQHTFPQYEGPPLQAIKACYKEWEPTDATECFGIPVDGVQSFRFWSLDLSGTPTLTWEFPGVPGFGDPAAVLTSLGKAPPVYTAVDTWNVFGRNTMVIDDPYRWPSCQPEICVVGIKRGLPAACDTNEAQCNCCDNGEDTAQFMVDVTGCEGFAGAQAVLSTRETDPGDFVAEYPGADWPASAPCGVWPFVLSSGDGCTVGDVSYSGNILVVIYCDGNDYQGDAYCFDTEINEWVNKSALSITWRCIDGCEEFETLEGPVTVCCTWVVEFTLPELDCCCPEEPPCCPCVADDERIVEVNFNSASGCSLTGQTVQNSGSTGCIFILDGLNDGDCQVDGGGNIECSDDGTWTLGVTTSDGAMGGITDWSSPAMTLTVNSCDPLDLEWTGSQGTVTLVEVP
jgi:hypothetical protein